MSGGIVWMQSTAFSKSLMNVQVPVGFEASPPPHSANSEYK
jgi:hypothetical protein